VPEIKTSTANKKSAEMNSLKQSSGRSRDKPGQKVSKKDEPKNALHPLEDDDDYS
jgi:hypothetical protein